MSKSKFEILLETASNLILTISAAHKERKKMCPTKSYWSILVWGIFLGGLFIISVIATIGHFSEGFNSLSRNYMCIIKDQAEFCYKDYPYHLQINKDSICKDYTSKHIDQICEPLINNLKNQDNVRTTE